MKIEVLKGYLKQLSFIIRERSKIESIKSQAILTWGRGDQLATIRKRLHRIAIEYTNTDGWKLYYLPDLT